MAKGLIILNSGFEDVEGLATIDVLRRAKIEMDIVALHDINIVSQSGIKLQAEGLISEVKLDSYDFLVIPGGGAVFKFLHKEKKVSEVIMKFAEANKLVATICAAPSLVGKLGLFKGKKYRSPKTRLLIKIPFTIGLNPYIRSRTVMAESAGLLC